MMDIDSDRDDMHAGAHDAAAGRPTKYPDAIPLARHGDSRGYHVKVDLEKFAYDRRPLHYREFGDEEDTVADFGRSEVDKKDQGDSLGERDSDGRGVGVGLEQEAARMHRNAGEDASASSDESDNDFLMELAQRTELGIRDAAPIAAPATRTVGRAVEIDSDEEQQEVVEDVDLDEPSVDVARLTLLLHENPARCASYFKESVSFAGDVEKGMMAEWVCAHLSSVGSDWDTFVEPLNILFFATNTELRKELLNGLFQVVVANFGPRELESGELQEIENGLTVLYNLALVKYNGRLVMESDQIDLLATRFNEFAQTLTNTDLPATVVSFGAAFLRRFLILWLRWLSMVDRERWFAHIDGPRGTFLTTCQVACQFVWKTFNSDHLRCPSVLKLHAFYDKKIVADVISRSAVLAYEVGFSGHFCALVAEEKRSKGGDKAGVARVVGEYLDGAKPVKGANSVVAMLGTHAGASNAQQIRSLMRLLVDCGVMWVLLSVANEEGLMGMIRPAKKGDGQLLYILESFMKLKNQTNSLRCAFIRKNLASPNDKIIYVDGDDV